MRFIYRLMTTLSTGLPLLVTLLAWQQLPTRFPLHFMPNGQPDRFGSRYEWYGQLVGTLLLLILVRALVLRAVPSKAGKGQLRKPVLYLITAGFVTTFITLLILQGLLSRPLFAQWQPVLVALLASSFFYFVVPPNEPVSTAGIQSSRRHQPKTVRQHLHPVSRLIGIRVNLLAALLMVVVPSQDRWSLAIMANGLAVLFLVMLGIRRQRQSTEAD